MANICLVYRLVWDWYYLKSLPACTGIKLVPDLGHTRPVWYLIPVLIPVSDPIYLGYKFLSFESSWSVCEMKKLWTLKIEGFIANCFKTFTSKFLEFFLLILHTFTSCENVCILLYSFQVLVPYLTQFWESPLLILKVDCTPKLSLFRKMLSFICFMTSKAHIWKTFPK